MQILHLLGQPASKFTATLLSSEVREKDTEKKQRKGAHIASTVHQVVTVRSIKHHDD
jgi:hypothetical protein